MILNTVKRHPILRNAALVIPCMGADPALFRQIQGGSGDSTRDRLTAIEGRLDALEQEALQAQRKGHARPFGQPDRPRSPVGLKRPSGQSTSSRRHVLR